jgi:hypothetical protein
VVLESDSFEKQRSEITPILKEIQTMVLSISSFTVVHTRRAANMVAHICAKNVSDIQSVVWENNPPSFLVKQLMTTMINEGLLSQKKRISLK